MKEELPPITRGAEGGAHAKARARGDSTAPGRSKPSVLPPSEVYHFPTSPAGTGFSGSDSPLRQALEGQEEKGISGQQLPCPLSTPPQPLQRDTHHSLLWTAGTAYADSRWGRPASKKWERSSKGNQCGLCTTLCQVPTLPLTCRSMCSSMKLRLSRTLNPSSKAVEKARSIGQSQPEPSVSPCRGGGFLPLLQTLQGVPTAFCLEESMTSGSKPCYSGSQSCSEGPKLAIRAWRNMAATFHPDGMGRALSSAHNCGTVLFASGASPKLAT